MALFESRSEAEVEFYIFRELLTTSENNLSEWKPLARKGFLP